MFLRAADSCAFSRLVLRGCESLFSSPSPSIRGAAGKFSDEKFTICKLYNFKVWARSGAASFAPCISLPQKYENVTRGPRRCDIRAISRGNGSLPSKGQKGGGYEHTNRLPVVVGNWSGGRVVGALGRMDTEKFVIYNTTTFKCRNGMKCRCHFSSAYQLTAARRILGSILSCKSRLCEWNFAAFQFQWFIFIWGDFFQAKVD